MAESASQRVTTDGPARTAIVTGAGSGIGRELARILAGQGHAVVLVSRNLDALAALADELRQRGGTASILQLDLAEDGAAQVLFDHVAGRTEVLVNNAGIGTFGPFAEADPEAMQEMIRVNVLALTRLTRLFLPGMIESRTGRILNVASTAAFQPGPLMAVYYATKAYVLHLSEALAEELRGSGVTVTALCPGPTRTDFHRRAAMEDSGLVTDRRPMDARVVALAGYQGMMRGRRVVIPGLLNRLLALAVRLAPRALVTRVVRNMQTRRPRRTQ